MFEARLVKDGTLPFWEADDVLRYIASHGSVRRTERIGLPPPLVCDKCHWIHMMGAVDEEMPLPPSLSVFVLFLYVSLCFDFRRRVCWGPSSGFAVYSRFHARTFFSVGLMLQFSC